MSVTLLDPLIQYYSTTLNIKPKITTVISKVIILYELLRIYEVRWVVVQEILIYRQYGIRILILHIRYLNDILSVSKTNHHISAKFKLVKDSSPKINRINI